jgi:hypothetical protein
MSERAIEEYSFMRLVVSLTVLASVGLNAVALLIGRGSFFHWVVVLAIAFYVAAPAMVLGVFAYLLKNRFRLAGQVARIAIIVSIVSASTLISLLPARALAKHDIDAAKAYCDGLIRKIELEKRANGVYPTDLSAFWHQGDGPWLLRRGLQYWSDGGQYEMTFGDPRGIMNFVSYRSMNSSWSEWH